MQMNFFSEEELARLADEAVIAGVVDGEDTPVERVEKAEEQYDRIPSEVELLGAIMEEAEKVSAPTGVSEKAEEENQKGAEQMREEKETLVLAVAGKPTNGTIFPKEEKLVWAEYQRVIDDMVKGMSEQGGYRLLIPIWNKFDLAFLKSAERHNVPVTFILPFKTWGETRLPKFQTDLVVRMKNKDENNIIIHNGRSFTERVHQAIRTADLVIGLQGSVDIEQFYPTMNEVKAKGTLVRPFPINRMQYTTEEEAVAIQQSEVEHSALAQQDVEDLFVFD